MLIWEGLLVPLIGTAIGAACVFCLRRLRPETEQCLLGFAAGVMIAASVWSLLLPAIARSAGWGRLAFIPAALGLALGFAFLLLLQKRVPEPVCAADGKTKMMLFAITLHNIPEGMAVGAAFAGVRLGSVAPAVAMALALGIAIQNIPEGAIISMPLAGRGMKKSRAFGAGVASGVVEPLAALLMLALTGLLEPLLPVCLAFAAGAMLYVAAAQLLREINAAAGIVCFAAGFLVMMVLDVALG